MGGRVSVQASGSGVLERVAAIALGIAVVCGCLRQGGFYPDGGALVVALVVVAVAARCGSRAPRVPGAVAAAIAALVALACWSFVSAALHGAAGDAVGPAAVVGVVAGAIWVGAGMSTPSWAVLRSVLLTCGVVVALTGWAGVALHVEPLALVSSGLWRASSTITYANASAAFLVITLLLAVATHRPERVHVDRCAVAVMLLGLLATMSRAGLLSLAVGLAICACSRARPRALWPAVPAAAVAAAGLLPALPDGSAAQPALAVAGLLAGVAVLVLARRRAGVLVLLAGCTVASLLAPAALHGIADTRLTSRSAERDDLRAVTVEQFKSSPVTGVGPGRLDFVYVDHRGAVVRAEYTHDEYLQTAAETGVVGLALVLAAFGALGVAAARRWSTPGGPGAAAVVAAFGVHSAFDFLWHIPVLPLLAAAAAVPLLTVRAPTPMGST